MLKTVIIGTEIDRLRGLSLLAQVIYLLGLRVRMDFGTGVVGGDGPKKIRYEALRTVAEFMPDKGSTKKYRKPTLEEVRAALQELVRRGLLEDRGSGRESGLIFFLPEAYRDHSVQNMNAVKNGVGTPQRAQQTDSDVSLSDQSLSSMMQCNEPHDERRELNGMNPMLSGKHLNTRGGDARAREGSGVVAPEAEMAIALRRHFVEVTSQHPALRGWVERGVSVEMALEAVDVAKQNKAGQRIPANYLAPIIERMLAQRDQPATTWRAASEKGGRISQNEQSRRRGIEYLRRIGDLSDAEWDAYCSSIGESGRPDPLRAGDGDAVAEDGGDLPEAVGAEDGGAGIVGVFDLGKGAGRRDH